MNRKINLKDKRKIFYGDYKVQINISNINFFSEDKRNNINRNNN